MEDGGASEMRQVAIPRYWAIRPYHRRENASAEIRGKWNDIFGFQHIPPAIGRDLGISNICLSEWVTSSLKIEIWRVREVESTTIAGGNWNITVGGVAES